MVGTPLSFLSRAALVFFLCVVPLFAALLAPFSLVPLLVLYLPPLAFAAGVYKYATAHRIDTNMLVHVFLGGFFPGIVIAMIVELLLSAVGGALFLVVDDGDLVGQMREYHTLHPNATTTEIASHIHLRHSLSVFVGLVFMSFVVAGSVEEYVKYWVVKGKCCVLSGLCVPNLVASSHDDVDPFFTVLCFAAAGCGFATMENVSYTFVSPSLAMEVWTAVVRALLSTPLHVVCASVTAMRLVGGAAHPSSSPKLQTTASRLTLFAALAPAIALHGTFDLQAFVFALWFPDMQVLSACASILCLVVGLLYLNHVRGHINWDYRVLVLDDVDGDAALIV
ncbi:Aste57867_18754 [Aphanomyces stellatus]|uniref:Aste57867_18754 protein n=1 Tax=Aphanomyces stellatus TaxID=120398 RepID=A0A485LAY6_9STRA|nr:hypothetical protein As57867_018690 [Aphanomyces stellatus]VFT95488.1 Aste57867_18754 [Aphanomyces stellatus]